MENTTVLATKRDFNRFTLVLKARCEAEGEVMVGLRDGTFVKVVFRPANEAEFTEDAFHTQGHGSYWEPSGHSVTSARFDIVEMVGMPEPSAGAARAWPGEVGPYSELNLSAAPRVVGTVVRGHIMRFDKRDSWAELLVALPAGTVAQDADAICHYRKLADGRFGEYYGWDASTEVNPIYVSADTVLPDEALATETRFRQACWLATRFAIGRYLMSNAHGRWDGAEKAHRHEELSKFYVAMARGVDPDEVRVEFGDDYKAVHDNTQKLTDHLDEVIGFPLESTPDYDVLERKFFERFHVLALEVLPPQD